MIFNFCIFNYIKIFFFLNSIKSIFYNFIQLIVKEFYSNFCLRILLILNIITIILNHYILMKFK